MLIDFFSIRNLSNLIVRIIKVKSIKSLRNASGNYFIKSKLSLLMNEKRPQGKLQFTSKKFQTILRNRVVLVPSDLNTYHP